MKRYLFLYALLAALLLASCKNEDIAVTRDVTFNVNPYSIVADFARHEVNPGDLVSFGYGEDPDYYRLRTYLLVYDTDGVLVEFKISDLRNYNENMTTTIDLPDGDYTVVAMALVFDKNHDALSWIVQGESRLEALRVVNNSEVKDLWKKLLGIDSRKIEVGVGDNVWDINIKPQSSLVINYLRSIHNYTENLYYQLFCNRESNKIITFDKNGVFNASYNISSSLSYPASDVLWKNHYPNQDDVYWYSFYTPMDQADFAWFAWKNSNVLELLGGKRSANIQAGRVFSSIIDLKAGLFEIQELE